MAMTVRTRIRSRRSQRAPREITLSQVANRLHCSVARAESLVRSGRLLGRRTARGGVTSEAAIQSYLHYATVCCRPSSSRP